MGLSAELEPVLAEAAVVVLAGPTGLYRMPLWAQAPVEAVPCQNSREEPVATPVAERAKGPCHRPPPPVVEEHPGCGLWRSPGNVRKPGTWAGSMCAPARRWRRTPGMVVCHPPKERRLCLPAHRPSELDQPFPGEPPPVLHPVVVPRPVVSARPQPRLFGPLAAPPRIPRCSSTLE